MQGSCGEDRYLARSSDQAGYKAHSNVMSSEPFITSFANTSRTAGGRDVLEIGVGLGAGIHSSTFR